MRIFHSFEEASVIPSPVVTTGTFDGVHIGHKTILSRLKNIASATGGESVLITFHPHPRAVLYPESAGKGLKLICSQEEKVDLLSRTGLDNLIVIEFTREFSKITGEMFVRDILCGILGARVIVVGHNHHFGFNQEGDYRKLWEWRSLYGFEAEEIPMQEVQHETVSSTRIRQAITEGYIQRANAYLDHFYIITGTGVDYSPADSFRHPAIKIPVTEVTKLVPPDGLYAASYNDGTASSRGLVCIRDCGAGQPDIILCPENPAGRMAGLKITLSFHKRLTDRSPGMSDGDYLEAGLREMEELIF